MNAAAPSAAASAAARRPRVAVVGAGFAGLAAALTLQRSGRVDVVVLEAGSRPGGRAHTQRLPGGLALEYGATWFHGLGDEREPNPVFRHAVEQGLIGAAPAAETWWSSQFLQPGATQPLPTAQQACVTHALATWTGAVESLPPDAAGTTADHLRAAWRQLLASGKVPPQQEALARRAWRWRELLQRAMDGCDSTSRQSARGLALYDEMPGGIHAPLPAGMQTIADRLAAQLGDRLRYRHAAQRIHWGGPAGVRIVCSAEGGQAYEVGADAAIVTVSLGVLKARHAQLFDPPLPEAQLAALERLRIGTVDKLILDFAPPVSDGDGRGPAAAAAAAAAAPAAATEAADASCSESAAVPAVSYALLWGEPWDGAGGVEPAAAPSEAEARVPAWLRGVFSLRFGGPEVKLPAAASQPTAAAGSAEQRSDLRRAGSEAVEEFAPCAEATRPTCYQAVAWVTGAEAEAMEAAGDEQVLAALRQLPAVFPQLQLPPGASWDAVTLHRSSWGRDPLFRGSYSYLGPEASPADVAALARPLCSGSAAGGDGVARLLLAGEACEVKYIGTMHGAYLSGRRQAEALLHALCPDRAAAPP